LDYHSATKKMEFKKAIKKIREAALYRRRREMQLINMAVSFFKLKMEERRKLLRQCVQNSNDGNYKRPLLSFEEKYRLIVARKKKDA
jgi:pyruvate-formate lyase